MESRKEQGRGRAGKVNSWKILKWELKEGKLSRVGTKDDG